jgi:hypothetical protein
MMRHDATTGGRPQARLHPPSRRARRKERCMECKKETNLGRCTCSYEPCSRKGTCCDCLAYHLRSRELPACAFPPDAERTYDRTFAHFARLVEKGRV